MPWDVLAHTPVEESSLLRSDPLPALRRMVVAPPNAMDMELPPCSGCCSTPAPTLVLVKILKESFKIYCAIYKRADMQAENLADYYEFCKELELAKTFQFPTLR